MKETVEEFIDFIRESWEAEEFVKLTLSKPADKSTDLLNIYARLVSIKGSTQLSLTFHYTTRDEVKNFDLAMAASILEAFLPEQFLIGNLFTTSETIELRFNKKRKAQLFFTKAQNAAKVASHDRQKKRFVVAEGNTYLHKMGISSAAGVVLKKGQRKFRQINKYVEILDHLVSNRKIQAGAHIVDMGCGKGYLTFALYDYLVNQKGMKVQMTGIELRQPLVDFCNQLAQECGFSGLQFIAKDIHEFNPDRIDILIALHACDTATDIAIAKGIRSSAEIIVVAPCCHKQIRNTMKYDNIMNPILKHGILEERQAEIITDGIRSLLMEASGYSTKVFEFIGLEHTSKNLMITGEKSKKSASALEEIEKIKSDYGIKSHYLETLLA